MGEGQVNSFNISKMLLLYLDILIEMPVALSSEQSPQTPAYASTQNSKKISSGIYFLDGFCT